MEKDSNTFLVPASSLQVMKKSKIAKEISTDNVTRRLNERSLSLSDIKIIMETLTDLQYAKKIKVASILSPKEISVPKLWFRLEGILGSPDPKLLEALESHFRTVYPLEKDLSKILGNILFDHGSHTLAVIPPAEIDKLAMSESGLTGESLDNVIKTTPLSLGIVDKEQGELTKALGVTLSDSISDIKRANLIRGARKNSVMSTLSGEGFLTKNENYGAADSRENNNPVVLYFPPDSVAPVFDPVDPSNHIGYYIAIDPKSGLPLTKIKDSNVNQKLEEQLKELGKTGESLNAQFSGIPLNKKEVKNDNDAEVFISAFNKKLAEELGQSLNNKLGDSIEVSNSSEVYRLILSNTLAKKQVKMLYLPAEIVTYFATEHNSKGMGISLIEKTKLISSLRTLVMMSDVLANIANSTPVTEVEIELDEDDPNQEENVEIIMNNIAKIDKSRSPVGVFDVSDVITAFRRANTRIKVSGGNVFPNTKTNVIDSSRSVTRVDQDLSDFLAKMQHSGIDVPSELIDRAMEGEFAVSTHTTNHLWSMTNMLVQATYIELLNDHVKKYIRFSPHLQKTIEELKGELTTEEIIESLTVVLPKHESASIQTIAEEFSAYSDLIDEIVAQYISDDLISDLVESSDNLRDVSRAVQAQVAAYFKRQWLINNNILPEVTSKLFVDEANDFKLGDTIGEFNEEMIASIGEIVNKAVIASGKADKKTRKAAAKADKKRNSADESETPPDDQGTGVTPPAPPEDGNETPSDDQGADDGNPPDINEDEFNF